MLNKKYKIFLTGGNGFLGKYVAQAFKEKGMNFKSPKYDELDILNRGDVIRKTKDFNVLVHLAGNVRTAGTDTAERHFNINTIGTLNVLEACRVNKIPRIILASSTEVYGRSSKNELLSENESLIPENFYGQSKLLAEHLCREYAFAFGIQFTILRFTYLYGFGMHDSRVIPKIITAASKNERLDLSVGKNDFLDIIYVKDAAKSIILSLYNNKSLNKIFNISSGTRTKLSDIAEVVAGFYPNSNFKIVNKKSDGRSFLYKNNQARRHLGFIPDYNLSKGLGDYITILKTA